MGAHRPRGRPQVGVGALKANPPLAVRVLPDEPAIDKTFDYAVPESWQDDGRARRLEIGTMVRVDLHGRRVGGWVTDLDPELEPGVDLKPLAKLVGHGPAQELVDLARWAAWRWAGRTAHFLGTASPPRVVAALPRRKASVVHSHDAEWFSAAFGRPGGVVRIPPAGDRWPLIQAATALGNPLIVTPGRATATALAGRLRRAGTDVALMPDDWAQAAGGTVVVGTRAAAFAPLHDCGAIVVLDEHDEGLVSERAPTWGARDVLVERARRLGVPCVLVSPHPSLEAQAWQSSIDPPRPLERAGWPRLHVIDRREEAPTAGVFSGPLADLMQRSDRIACVLNRKGRSGLLACGGCGELASCVECGSALAQLAEGELVCRSCGVTRPVVCPLCGSTRFKNLRMGVDRVRGDLEALLRRPVAEVTASGWAQGGPDADVVVGTEAVLHQVGRVDLVAFLEFDQELVAPRFRATEQALALLSKASRLVGPRSWAGAVAVQTRTPEHPLFIAVAAGRPADLDAATLAVRSQLSMPPSTAIASLSGAAAAEYAGSVEGTLGVEVIGPLEAEWLIRAEDFHTLCNALEQTPRPGGRLRVAVDPRRV